MARALFQVKGRLEMASQEQEASVSIDRANNTFTVKPRRSRRQYTLPLDTVAEMVVQKIIISEVQQQRQPRTRLAKRGLLGVSG